MKGQPVVTVSRTVAQLLPGAPRVKVFAVAMLMYGMEPSWGEMRRWIRES